MAQTRSPKKSERMAKVAAKPRKKPARKPSTKKAPPRKKTTPPRKRGRPTVYSEDIGDEICNRLMMGESLNGICRDDHMPSEAAVRGWAIDPKHGFSARYARARELGFLRMADEIFEIADDGTNDWMERTNKDGETVTVVNHEHIQRSRLRVDTRKWILSKMLPKIYGDKLGLEHTGKDGGPIETKEVSDLEYARRIAFALAKATATDVECDDNASG